MPGGAPRQRIATTHGARREAVMVARVQQAAGRLAITQWLSRAVIGATGSWRGR